jgi:plastocyanin
MSRNEVRRASIAFVIAVLLVGGGAIYWVASAPARAQAAVDDSGASSTSVTAESGFTFTPDSIGNLPVGTNVSVTFTDNDALAHTFTVIGKQGWVIPTGISESAFDQLVWGDTPHNLLNLNATPAGGSGDQITGSISVPAAGWYEFVCTEPGHFQSGMYGFIAFGMAVPSNLSVSTASTDPGIAVFIIVGVIVTLVVIALVLGFVVGRRRGSSDEMKPQRLGYPEPEEPETSSSVAATSPPEPESLRH